MKKTGLLTLTAALAVLSIPAIAQDDGATTEVTRGPGAGPMAQVMFQKMDTDESGTISESEFTSQCAERFAKMDADGNGELTHEEMKAAHAERREKMRGKMMHHRENKRPPVAEETE